MKTGVRVPLLSEQSLWNHTMHPRLSTISPKNQSSSLNLSHSQSLFCYLQFKKSRLQKARKTGTRRSKSVSQMKNTKYFGRDIAFTPSDWHRRNQKQASLANPTALEFIVKVSSELDPVIKPPYEWDSDFYDIDLPYASEKEQF
jgi:hypothetical protein